jgi:hypothetical protein
VPVVLLSVGIAVFAYQFYERQREPVASIPTREGQTGWRTLNLTDSLTGKGSVEYYTSMAKLDGPDGLDGYLRIRCNGKSLDAFIVFTKIFSFNKYPRWVMSQDNWVIPSGFISARSMPDGKTVFLNDDRETETLFDFLKEENRDLRIRISVSDGQSITMKPDLKGASAAVDKVRAECRS